MPQLVERGHLYIAQPPLFRVKRGKSEKYLKDEAALEDYLIELGVEGIRLKIKGIELTGKELGKLTKKLVRYGKILSLVQQKLDPRIVDAVVEVFTGDREVLKAGKKLDAELDKIARYLKKHHKGLRDFQLDVENDPEHGTERVVYLTNFNNAPRRTMVDVDFLSSAEFAELKKLAAEFEKLGEGSFTITQEETLHTVDTLEEVKNLILANGEKGQEIQRYKGLGEMNPHQLWDTTMNPETRTLLQVKVEDAVEADQIFTVLMGDQVEPRRQFIEQNALAVRNLDI
jgi:DNA gyrase subunit B